MSGSDSFREQGRATRDSPRGRPVVARDFNPPEPMPSPLSSLAAQRRDQPDHGIWCRIAITIATCTVVFGCASKAPRSYVSPIDAETAIARARECAGKTGVDRLDECKIDWMSRFEQKKKDPDGWYGWHIQFRRALSEDEPLSWGGTHFSVFVFDDGRVEFVPGM